MSYSDVEAALVRFQDNSSDLVEGLVQDLARSLTRVIGADTTLLTSDGGTISTTVYQVDMSVGGVLVGGLYDTLALLNDQDLLADVTCVDLAGDAAVAIADAQGGVDVEVALCAVVVNDVIVIRGVFGAEAATGVAVAPTAAQCSAALALAAEADYTPSEMGLVFARILIESTASAQVVTDTFSNAPEVGDILSVTVNGIETTHTADSTVLNDEVGDLRVLVVAALAAEDVTVSGATSVIIVTGDNAGEPFTYDSSITLVAAGSLAVAEVLTTPYTANAMTHTAAATNDALKQERLAGILA